MHRDSEESESETSARNEHLGHVGVEWAHSVREVEGGKEGCCPFEGCGPLEFLSETTLPRLPYEARVLCGERNKMNKDVN